MSCFLAAWTWITEHATVLAMVVSALAAFWIAFYTVKLTSATIEQAVLTRDALKLTRDGFNATHRPKIRVRHLWLSEPVAGGKPLVASLVLANVGDAIAIIDTMGFDYNVISLDGVLPGGLNVQPATVWRENNRLGLGETATFRLESHSDFHPTHFENVVTKKDKRLCCFGFVQYFDEGPTETRKIRRTEFCRILRFPAEPIEGNGRFFRLDKPDEDYEYED